MEEAIMPPPWPALAASVSWVGGLPVMAVTRPPPMPPVEPTPMYSTRWAR